MTLRFAAPAVMGGADYRRATELTAAELTDAELHAPHLQPLLELPQRGNHASLLGRTVAHLTELYAELASYGWRLVQRPGADHSRAVSLLNSDVDALADVRGERADTHHDDAPLPLNLEVLGPVSLAAQLHLPGGEKALIDHGARRDLADSLATGLMAHVAHVRRAAAAEQVHVVLLEPDYARVLAGDVPTASGYRTLRSLHRDETRQLLGVVVQALRDAGAASVILDFGQPVTAEQIEDFRSRSGIAVDGFTLPVHLAQTQDWERAAALVEAGAQLWAALLDPQEADHSTRLPQVSALAERLAAPWRGLGMPLTALEAFTVTGCGAEHRGRLARLSEAGSMRTLTRLRGAAEALTDQIRQ